jgi:biotin carboxyl carrier protein
VQYEIEVNGRPRKVTIHRDKGVLRVLIDGKECAVDALRVDDHTLSLLIQESDRSSSYEISLAPVAGGLTARVGIATVAIGVNGRRRAGRKDGGVEAGDGPQRIVAPMPGKVVRVLVKAGEAVQARQPVVVVEAMKMENELRAAVDGTLAEVHVRDGESVEAGALLAVIHR